jgi:hypothetical protein
VRAGSEGGMLSSVVVAEPADMSPTEQSYKVSETIC